MRREWKKIVFEFRKMFHTLVIFLIGNLFLTAVLLLLPEPRAWTGTKAAQAFFILIAIFYEISAFVFEIFVFTSIVRHYTGEEYLLEQLGGRSIYEVFAHKLPVNILLYGFLAIDYYGINTLIPKYLASGTTFYFNLTGQIATILMEGLVFVPIFVAFVYLWCKSFMKYLAGLNTLIISLVMMGITDSINYPAWEICAVELILSAFMLRKSQRIAVSEYDQT
jgi:hypothetical protein